MQIKKGFTLVELLVVVLIIGVLSAIAIPMYQGAVDKSHWSTMLPGAKAIKDAEEAIKMSNGEYTNTMANLDVTMENADLTFSLITPNNTSDPNVIRVTNSKLANVRLASYLDDSPMFAGQLHCEAKTGDERAERLCGKLLNGQDLTSTDGYTGYLLDQDIDKSTCDNASRTWSNKNTKCYKTNEDRCKANGMPYKDGFCGYKGNSGTEDNRLVIEEGGICEGKWNGCAYLDVQEGGKCVDTGGAGCKNSIFHAGSVCENGCGGSVFDGKDATCKAIREGCSSGSHGNIAFKNEAVCVSEMDGVGGCQGNTYYSGSGCIAKTGGCRSGTFYEGTSCVAEVSSNMSCGGGTFKSGSKCIANAPGTCLAAKHGLYTSVNYDGGCCEGPYCPTDVPKC